MTSGRCPFASWASLSWMETPARRLSLVWWMDPPRRFQRQSKWTLAPWVLSFRRSGAKSITCPFRPRLARLLGSTESWLCPLARPRFNFVWTASSSGWRRWSSQRRATHCACSLAIDAVGRWLSRTRAPSFRWVQRSTRLTTRRATSVLPRPC